MASFEILKDVNSDVELYIYNPNESKMFKCIVKEPVVWTTEQEDNPSKLEFTVLKFTDGDGLSFQEGNIVIFKYKGVEVFRGRIFQKQRDKEHHIACVAYDTLRYLKNSVNPRTLNMHKGTTTTKILEYLCSMNNTVFTKGDDKDGKSAFAKTEQIVTWNEVSPKTYFDVIKEASEQTRISDPNHTIYTLYDECGKLYYKTQEDMKLDLVINHDSLENFNYTSSIDGDTYNRVLLYWGDDEGSTTTTKKTTGEVRMTSDFYHREDEKHISDWGLLELTKKIDSKTSNYIDMAKKLLEYHNKKTRDLTLEGCFGDVRARAGTSVILNLDLGDIAGGRYGFVKKARHTFEHKFHTMDLDVEILTPDEVIKVE